VVISVLLLLAAATRFWRLGDPDVIVFDEKYTVSMARCYLSRLPYRSTHPPLASILIALGIRIFGDNPWGWRLPAALFGTALVAITYLLGRRMFESRLVGGLAAGFVACDGLFLVDSRIVLWEIFYLTFAAFAYLMLFRFARCRDTRSGRNALAWIGLALGLELGSKLFIPAITILLTTGFAVVILVTQVGSPWKFRSGRRAELATTISGVLALVGGLSGFVYLALFIPHYWFGWWRGIGDQATYYRGEVQHQRMFIGRSHPYASPWWSWPLMLRTILYWTKTEFFNDPNALVASIRALGNPVIWWGAVVSIALVALRAIRQRSLARSFLAFGYVTYLAMWIPIPRYQFVYYYMPALYLGILALASLLSECWQGSARFWEHASLLGAVCVAVILGIGASLGTGIIAVLVGTYLAIYRRKRADAGALVAGVFVASVVVVFVYFAPLWMGLPVTAAGFRQRMWLHSAGLANWI
jgi:dolichyl-phosphate-mannose--protein O-mannosyl transferase